MIPVPRQKFHFLEGPGLKLVQASPDQRLCTKYCTIYFHTSYSGLIKNP
jgi:hypothetical protein